METCVFCGGDKDAPQHQSDQKTWHTFAPPTLPNKLLALAKGFTLETRELLLEAARIIATKDMCVVCHCEMEPQVKHCEDCTIEDDVEGEEDNAATLAIVSRDRPGRYSVQEIVEDRSNGTKRVMLRIWADGEVVSGDSIVLLGPAADVDDYVHGQATISEIGERWRERSKRRAHGN